MIFHLLPPEFYENNHGVWKFTYIWWYWLNWIYYSSLNVSFWELHALLPFIILCSLTKIFWPLITWFFWKQSWYMEHCLCFVALTECNSWFIFKCFVFYIYNYVFLTVFVLCWRFFDLRSIIFMETIRVYGNLPSFHDWLNRIYSLSLSVFVFFFWRTVFYFDKDFLSYGNNFYGNNHGNAMFRCLFHGTGWLSE